MPNNLKHKITLIGSTGLIGTHFFEEIHPDDFEVVNAITRRRIPNIENKDFIKRSVHDFSDLEKNETRPDNGCSYKCSRYNNKKSRF